MMTEPFVQTSIARHLITRLQATHDRRRISVFSGPPGIGKTTAINAWCRKLPAEVAVVKIGRQDAKESMVLQHTLEAIRGLTQSTFTYTPTSLWELRKDVFGAICAWAGADPLAARKGDYRQDAFGRLTLVFDEAQNLSRQAIEALRYWNDPDRCYAPFPIGLVFVGNSEFSMADTGFGGSVISAAVADRALYMQSFEYDELTDDDLKLVMDAHGLSAPEPVAAILKSFRTPRAIRSLRRVMDLIDDLRDSARGGTVTRETVNEVLGLV